MKTTKRHFELFQSAFKTYAEMLGLQEWEVYFFLTDLEEDYSILITNDRMSDRLAAVHLATEWGGVEFTDEEIIKTARHEALELLVDDLRRLAKKVLSTEDEINLVGHILVRRLEKSIKNPAFVLQELEGEDQSENAGELHTES